MLATVIIIVAGAAVCAFIAAADSSDLGVWMGTSAVVGAILLVAWVVWYRYGRSTTNGMGFWFSLSRSYRDDDLANQYEPRKVRDKRSEAPTGNNRPITADEAHEIQQQSANTWVPSKNRKSGK